MIVNENYRRGVFRDGFAKHFSRMNERRIEQPARYGYVALQSMLRVEDCNMKFLDRQILEPLPENFVNVARTANRNSLIAFLRRHAASKLECGVDGDRARVANSAQTFQSCNRLR
jgi:hypothetical protein